MLTACRAEKKGVPPAGGTPFFARLPSYPLSAAWAAARRAIGTRYGEQET